jgi:hypothetical protein
MLSPNEEFGGAIESILLNAADSKLMNEKY